MKTILAISLILFSSSSSFAKEPKKTSMRKVQEVNFDEMSLKGTLRNPEGAYLVQKRGIKFMPLYDLQKNFDQKIRNTSDYLR